MFADLQAPAHANEQVASAVCSVVARTKRHDSHWLCVRGVHTQCIEDLQRDVSCFTTQRCTGLGAPRFLVLCAQLFRNHADMAALVHTIRYLCLSGKLPQHLIMTLISEIVMACVRRLTILTVSRRARPAGWLRRPLRVRSSALLE